jgi:hypothetical protein
MRINHQAQRIAAAVSDRHPDETIRLNNAAKNRRLCKKSVLISAILGKLLPYVSKHQNAA